MLPNVFCVLGGRGGGLDVVDEWRQVVPMVHFASIRPIYQYLALVPCYVEAYLFAASIY